MFTWLCRKQNVSRSRMSDLNVRCQPPSTGAPREFTCALSQGRLFRKRCPECQLEPLGFTDKTLMLYFLFSCEVTSSQYFSQDDPDPKASW